MERLHNLSGNVAKICALQFSHDERHVATHAKDGQVLCWEVEGGEKVSPSFSTEEWLNTKEHQGAKFSLALSWPMIGIWHPEHKLCRHARASHKVVAEANNTPSSLHVS